MAEPQPSFNPRPSKPRLALPRGACDTHFHVFGPAKTVSIRRRPDLHARRRAEGSAVCDAQADRHRARRGGAVRRSRLRQFGVGRPDRRTAESTMSASHLPPSPFLRRKFETWTARDFAACASTTCSTWLKERRSTRCISFAGKLAELGWHLQIHLESSRVAELSPALRRSPVPVVIDHMARVDASKGMSHPDFQSLLSLLGNRNVWVKVSGCERISRQSSPWKDAVPFARKLVEEFPAQTLWGTDWPHPEPEGNSRRRRDGRQPRRDRAFGEAAPDAARRQSVTTLLLG